MKTTIKFIIAVAAMAISIASNAQNMEPVLTAGCPPPIQRCYDENAQVILTPGHTAGYTFTVRGVTRYNKINSTCLSGLKDINGFSVVNGSIINIRICENERWVNDGNGDDCRLISTYISSFPTLCP